MERELMGEDRFASQPEGDDALLVFQVPYALLEEEMLTDTLGF